MGELDLLIVQVDQKWSLKKGSACILQNNLYKHTAKSKYRMSDGLNMYKCINSM